jgi:hypothetical protein
MLLSQGMEFYNIAIQCLTQHWQKYVENDEDLVEKWPVIAKDVRIIHVNLIVIAVTFSEKKLEVCLSYCTSCFTVILYRCF